MMSNDEHLDAGDLADICKSTRGLMMQGKLLDHENMAKTLLLLLTAVEGLLNRVEDRA